MKNNWKNQIKWFIAILIGVLCLFVVPFQSEAAVPPPPVEAQNALGFERDDFVIPRPTNYDVTNNAQLSRTYKNVVEITQDQSYQYGVMWYKEKIDLTKNFEFEAYVYLGSKSHREGGADGITVTFHNDPLGLDATGGTGQGIGAYPGPTVDSWQTGGVVRNGIAFEADTYFNGTTYDYDRGLPEYSINEGHIGVVNLKPTFRELLVKPHEQVGFIRGNNRLTDNSWRKMSVKWDSYLQILTFDIEDFNTITYRVNNVNATFGGTTAYWGMTGSTGANYNSQHVALTLLPNKPNPVIDKKVRNLSAKETTFKKETAAKPGDQVEFEINVSNIDRNNNIGHLKEAKLFDDLPRQLTWNSGTRTVDGGAEYVMRPSEWQEVISNRGFMYGYGGGSMHYVNETYRFTLKATVNKGTPAGRYTNTAKVTSRTSSAGKKYESSASVIIDEEKPKNPNPSIDKKVRNVSKKEQSFVKKTVAKPGEEVEFEMKINNLNAANFGGAITNARFRDVLPSQLEYGAWSLTTPGGSRNLSDNQWLSMLGSAFQYASGSNSEHKVGEEYTVKVKATVKKGTPKGIYTNRGLITGDNISSFTKVESTADVQVEEEGKQIRINKKDKGKNFLPGATFDITNNSGVKIATGVKTDSSGKYLSETLPLGTYKVTETKAPDGYVLSTSPSQTVTLSATSPDIVDVTFVNDKAGSLKIVKKDKNSQQVLSGARYEVKNSSGTVIKNSQEAVTNNNGEYTIANLANGTYTVREVTPPNGYALADEDTQKVTVTVGSQSLVTFMNEKAGSLKIIKKDKETGELLQGAAYEVKDSSGKIIVDSQTAITNKNGEYSINNLPKGTYKVREITPPSGYKLAKEETQNITVQNDHESEAIFYNEKAVGKIKIIKVDEATPTKRLSGAVFRILKTPTSGIALTDLVTDINGEINTSLPPGTYYVQEVKPPVGYTKDASIKEIKVVDNEVLEVTFSNKPRPGKLEVTKVDKDNPNIKLSKAEFSVVRDDNGVPSPVVPNKVTNTSGTAVFSNLIPGIYTVTEVKPPAGYDLSEPNSQSIEVLPLETAYLQFENKKTVGQIKIVKVDQKNHAILLPDAKFDIDKKQGKNYINLDKGVTDENGVFLSKKLEPGTYYVRETESPKGYQIIDSEYREVVISESGVQIVTFENAKDEKDNIIHIRQTVLNAHDEVVIPKKGYADFSSMKDKEKFSIIANSSPIDKVADIKQELFTSRIVNPVTNKVQVDYRIPEYYDLVGSIVTETDNNLGNEHFSGNQEKLKNGNVILDFDKSNQYWITYFIKPSVPAKESPAFYSWHNILNDLGSVTIKK
ncbi:SpaA isopeptide-forming pilin-related protein [Vagococcus silagei]|nr:SpaA isopeptide-forming pilin-related protein [Vagococcus silagei]